MRIVIPGAGPTGLGAAHRPKNPGHTGPPVAARARLPGVECANRLLRDEEEAALFNPALVNAGKR